MSLADIANEIKNSGFDARKDNPNEAAQIPAGTYKVLLRSTSFNIYDSGWETLRYEFIITGGDQDSQTERADFGTLDFWNGKSIKWAQERTTKFFMKAIVLSGDELLQADFENGQALCQALQRKAVGSFYLLEVKETTSKGKTYRQYDLLEGTARPDELTVEPENLPF